MKWLFFALIVIHGLIHLMGPAITGSLLDHGCQVAGRNCAKD
ncbi:MAG: hypothetical protein OEO79_15405 [Gemmatimonadota bacterium]|nr:hypothetical protein [Gemmatimonadota bacterium]